MLFYFFIYSIQSDATAVVSLHVSRDGNESSSLGWSGIMHVVSFTGVTLREQYLQLCGMEGRGEECVRACMRM